MPRTINQGFENVSLSRLKPHPRNVNQGDTGAIHESIEANGFYGAVVANKRTGHILAGNHRYHAAKAAHFTELPVVWVDVSDEEEVRILLADNRTTRLGSDNQAALAELLAELAGTDAGLSGTGFDGDDLDRIISDIANTPIGLDSARDAEQMASRLSGTKTADNGKNSDGSIYAICPECNHEFAVKNGKADKVK